MAGERRGVVRSGEEVREIKELIELARRAPCELALRMTKNAIREIATEAKWLYDHGVSPKEPWAGIKCLVDEGRRDEAAEALRHVLRLKARQRALVRALNSVARFCGMDKWFTVE